VRFAASRTLVDVAVSTLALAFLAAVHWLLGRMIEHSGVAIGLEGIAAISRGLVPHRTSHGPNLLVDGAAHPVLAIPVVVQHALIAVVL
jgi:hypothetical protein